MNEVVELYFKMGIIRAECAKVCDSKGLLDDFVQEVSLILLEKDSTFLSSLHSKGQLLYYIRRIITNQYRSETSPFYTKFKKFQNSTNNIEDYGNKIDGQEAFPD